MSNKETVELRAEDGHLLDAYVGRPEGEPIGGLVVVQEIFGVNAHIRRVVDGYARDRFLSIAPALFDRYERGVNLGYESEDRKKAMSFAPRLDIAKALADTEAAVAWLKKALPGKKAGVIGFCFGGTVAWLMAARPGVDAAVGYYGGRIASAAGERLLTPVMLHFGNHDAHIPKQDVDRIAAAHPEVQIFRYEAGHGFNCDMRKDFAPEAARVARERSLAFLKEHLAE